MTAEIIVMNKMAIAMAADSAVTIGQKIYNSANKLFTLSKYHPVGIMIYGNASFMDIPWETIIKVYRQKLGEKKCATLYEYADDFIGFLANENPLFPEIVQDSYFRNTATNYFGGIILEDIKIKVKEILEVKKRAKDSEVRQVVASVINEHYVQWDKPAFLPTIPKRYIRDFLKKYEPEIDKIIKSIFEKLPLSKGSIKQLKQIGGYLFSKDRFPKKISGIVVAGYGDKEIFPAYKSCFVECKVNNSLKFKIGGTDAISYINNASIVPFAQSEMVATFMEGIDPDLQEVSESSLKSIFDKYPAIVAKNIGGNDEERQKTETAIKIESKKIFEDYIKEMGSYRRQNHVTPVLSAVSVLPKDELAAMAEALVNLTSFKRRITMDAETVGGPIDVAIISKGDGFIWIKRKHYFKPELNQHFMLNYYRKDK